MANPTTDSVMYTTIQRQPDDLRHLLREGGEPARQAAALIGDAERIFVTGIGTSYHAALVGAWLLRETGRDARAVLSYDLATYPESYPIRPSDAVIVMAHTGVKSSSAMALRWAVEAGATVISVGSMTAEHPGSQLVLRTIEREKSAAYTSSHLCAMTVLAQVATELGAGHLRSELEWLPELVADVIEREPEITPVAVRAAGQRVYAIGAGPNEATALELVIKCREAALHPVDALAAEQFFHGPIVTVNGGDLGVVVNVPGPAHDRVAGIATAMSRIGAELWTVGEPLPDLPGTTPFGLPPIVEALSPLLAVVPMQLFAYSLAATKGAHPDTFRRDDPIYKDAFGLLTL